MKPNLWQRFRDWICNKTGHYPDKKNGWYYDHHHHANCKCCGQVITKFHGKWE